MLENTQWKDAYHLGDETIDNQHKNLFKLVKRFIDLDKSNSPKDDLKKLILDFNEYMRSHFSYEESFMKENDYPDAQKHTLQHQKIINNLYAILKQPEQTSKLRLKMQTIVQALIDHIMHEDREFRKWYNAHLPAASFCSIDDCEYEIKQI